MGYRHIRTSLLYCTQKDKLILLWSISDSLSPDFNETLWGFLKTSTLVFFLSICSPLVIGQGRIFVLLPWIGNHLEVREERIPLSQISFSSHSFLEKNLKRMFWNRIKHLEHQEFALIPYKNFLLIFSLFKDSHVHSFQRREPFMGVVCQSLTHTLADLCSV